MLDGSYIPYISIDPSLALLLPNLVAGFIPNNNVLASLLKTSRLASLVLGINHGEWGHSILP